MNKSNNIKLADGQEVRHIDKATYLGGILTRDVSALTEIQNRIVGCIPTLKKVDLFWMKCK